MLSVRCLAAVLSLALAAMPVSAEPLPRPDAIATPAERPLLQELAATLSAADRSPDALLARLDHLLPQLASPTPLRGLVQYLRGNLLNAADRGREAKDAIDESIRLLPAYSAPLLLGAQLATFSDHPDEAASLLMRASRVDPEIARRISDYDLSNMLGRLPENNGRRTRLAVIERMFEIGWRGEGPDIRSRYARLLIDRKLEQGDIAGARALLTHIMRPQDARTMMMQNRYQPIWPDIERWAGPQERTLWAIYLNETRESWAASHDLDRGRDYVDALDAAQRYQDIVDEFLPLFRSPNREGDYTLQWIAPIVARALAHLDRWDEAEALYAGALLVWPVGGDANALNLLANRGRLRLSHGDPVNAVADMRASIEDSNRRDGDVSANALLPMHRELACALHRLGRDNEGMVSSAIVFGARSVSANASLRLCTDQVDAARDALVAALGDDERRDAALDFLDDDEPPLASAYDREMSQRRQALRRDPRIAAAVAAHGRFLPYPLTAGASTSPGSRE